MIRGYVALRAAAVALVCSIAAPAAVADSLVGVVQEALEGHPELAAIRFNRRAIDNELNAARGLNLPTVDSQYVELGLTIDTITKLGPYSLASLDAYGRLLVGLCGKPFDTTLAGPIMRPTLTRCWLNKPSKNNNLSLVCCCFRVWRQWFERIPIAA